MTDYHAKFIAHELTRRCASDSIDKLTAVLSEQTIYQDIDFLRRRGYSIRSERHADLWAYYPFAKPATDSSEKGLVQQ